MVAGNDRIVASQVEPQQISAVVPEDGQDTEDEGSLTDSWDQEEETAPKKLHGSLPSRPVNFQKNVLRLPVPVCTESLHSSQPLAWSVAPEPDVTLWNSLKRSSDDNSPAAKIRKPSRTMQVWKSRDGLSGIVVLPSVEYQEVRLDIQQSTVRGHCKVLVNNELCIDTTLPCKASESFSIAVGGHSIDVYESDHGCFEVLVDGIPFHQLSTDKARRLDCIQGETFRARQLEYRFHC